jgi:hypothetical protein
LDGSEVKEETKTMETQVSPRREMETALIEKCWKDSEFKKAVVGDPKGTLERHIGRKLPVNLRIFIHEEDANTLHFALPPTISNVTELSDQELEKVAGGTEVVLIATLISCVAVATAGQGRGW